MGTSANYYLSFDQRAIATTSIGLNEVIAATDGTISNLKVDVTVAPGGATSRTFTVYKDGSATAVTVTISGASVTASDAANSVSYVAGNRLRLQATLSGSPATTDALWSVDEDSDDTVSSFVGTNIATAKSGFVDPFSGELSATASVCQRLIAYPGTITAIFTCANSFNVTAGALNIYLYLNDVKQDGTGGTVDTLTTVGIAAAGTVFSSTFSLPVVRTDYIYYGLEETPTFTSTWVSVSFRFESATAGVSLIANRGGSDPGASVANYHGINLGQSVWATTNTTLVQVLCGITPVGLGMFLLDVSVDPGAAPNTRDFETMKAGSVPGGAPAGTISTGVLRIDDTTGAVDFTSGEVVGPLRHTPTSTPTVSGTEYWALAMYDVGTGPPEPPIVPPPPGGSGGTGTNPTNGNLPTTLPLIMCYVKLGDGTVYVWSEAWAKLNDLVTWYTGPKEARINGLSDIRTEMARDGAPKAYTWDVELSDTDGVLRTAARTNTLKGGYCALYVFDDATRRAEGVPFRFAAGYVTTHQAREPMTMTLQCEGALGRKLARINSQPKIPNHITTIAATPGLDSRRDGKTVMVGLGAVSDEANASPEGVMPWQYTGTDNLQVFCGAGAVSVVVDAYLISQGALGYIYDSYATIPEWGDGEVAEVGDLIRPADDTRFYFVATVAGTTGSSEPTWPTSPGSVSDGSVTWTLVAALDTLQRVKLPPQVYGTILVTPFKAGWTTATGLSTQYVDSGTPTRRYSVAFVLTTHRYARALREGRIQVASNGLGLTEVSDGTGPMYFSDPVEIAKFTLIQEGFSSTDYITYATIPDFDAPEGPYSIMDTASFDAVKALGTTWHGSELLGATMLGRDGNQQKLFDLMREAAIGGYFKFYENNHGQLAVHRHNPAATPTVTFEAWEILAGSVECWLDDENYANHLRQFSAYRYEKQKNAATTTSSDWANPVYDSEDGVAQDPVTGIGETITREIQNYFVRDTASIATLTTKELALSRGPTTTRDGCPMMAFSVRWKGLVGLGTCIHVTHPEARRPTAQDMVVEGRVVSALKGVVRLTCRILEAGGVGE